MGGCAHVSQATSRVESTNQGSAEAEKPADNFGVMLGGLGRERPRGAGVVSCTCFMQRGLGGAATGTSQLLREQCQQIQGPRGDDLMLRMLREGCRWLGRAWVLPNQEVDAGWTGTSSSPRSKRSCRSVHCQVPTGPVPVPALAWSIGAHSCCVPSAQCWVPGFGVRVLGLRLCSWPPRSRCHPPSLPAHLSALPLHRSTQHRSQPPGPSTPALL